MDINELTIGQAKEPAAMLQGGKYLYPERYNIGNTTMFTKEEARNIINCLDTYNTNVEYVSMKVQDFIALYKAKHEVKSA